MKNFPHQFNNLAKLYNALAVAKRLIGSGIPLTDNNFGEQLTREGIYTYRNRELSIDEFLAAEHQKPTSNRGYLTVSRDIRRFFELLGFLTVLPDKSARLSPAANQLLMTVGVDLQKQIWKNSLLHLGIEGIDGEVSHPYRILLKLVNKLPGIETPKLLLALEAENDSEEEFERITNLAQRSIDEIITDTGTSKSMAANAVKILPGIAEQLNDIVRVSSRAYPVGQVSVTEDEISTEEDKSRRVGPSFRQSTVDEIARNPNLNNVASVSIDLADAIRIRQQRLTEHQEIVRQLAFLNAKYDFSLFEGKFDCLATKEEFALLYEVKTILPTASDLEKQTVKGVGQLKYYKFSIVHREMGYDAIQDALVFSIRPKNSIIEFCNSERIDVIWRENEKFYFFNRMTQTDEDFLPDKLI